MNAEFMSVSFLISCFAILFIFGYTLIRLPKDGKIDWKHATLYVAFMIFCLAGVISSLAIFKSWN